MKKTEMREQITDLLPAIRCGKCASLEVEIEGNIYTRQFEPRERLVVLGGGNVGQQICRYGATVGFSVVVVDDRPAFANRICFPEADEIYCDAFVPALEQLHIGEQDYVTVVTRGHRYDMECLRSILAGNMPYYLGVLSSKRRSLGVYDILQKEGVDESLLEQIHMPVGLSIGAVTPAEIGLSVVAELIQCRRKKTKRRSQDLIMTCKDIDYSLIDFLEKDKTPKVLLLVYETRGSTPVKSGAIMAMNQNMQTAGTIGGGCAENAVLHEALLLIGTGKEKSVDVDLNHEVAAEAGMACGGHMKVWVADISGGVCRETGAS